jgi:hypothetical protein
MKTLSFLFLIFSLPVVLMAQDHGGCSFTGGVAEHSPFSFSISYLHPVSVKQLYLQGGYRYYDAGYSQTDDIFRNTFKSINQVHIGAFLGDYLVVNPKLTYNWYGRHRSPGWGIAAGMLTRPLNRLGMGISVGYDQIRFDSSLNQYGAIRNVSYAIILNVYPFH